ncbi:MAG: hypothetical protein AAF721_10120 [Myxococcota bacterium]
MGSSFEAPRSAWGWLALVLACVGCGSATPAAEPGDDATGGSSDAPSTSAGAWESDGAPASSSGVEGTSTGSSEGADAASTSTGSGSSSSEGGASSTGDTTGGDGSSSTGADLCLDEHPEWTSGEDPCITADACPRLRFHCVGSEDYRLAGCHLGTCIDDRAAFAEDFCAPYGGVGFGGSNSGSNVCNNVADFEGCLQCRHDLMPACVAGPCATEATALQTCIDADVPPLPPGVAFAAIHYTVDSGFPCYEQGIAYRECVADDCPEVLECESKGAFDHAPLLGVWCE